MKNFQKQILLVAALLFVVVLAVQLVTTNTDGVTEVQASETLKKAAEGQLNGVEVTLTIPENGGNYTATWELENRRYRSELNEDNVRVLNKVSGQESNAPTIRNNTKETSGIAMVLGQLLPVALIILFLFFVMRQIQIGGGKAMSFGKSRARMVADGHTKVTFKDVAGAEEAKEELAEIVDFLRDPKKFTRLGGRIPKGVLLMGSPGTGKTLLAKAIAGEAGVPFFSISGSDFVEMFVGVGASRVRDLFEQSKKHAPCIMFVDEIDAVGRHRGAGLGGGHDEREQTLNQLLVEMDGFEANEGVIVIAATNRPDVLDPALLRPGRFDRRVVVGMPDVGGRAAILKVHTRKVPLDDNVELETVARGTPGFAGADLANLVNEAALMAAKNNKSKVDALDFEAARDKVLMGSERRSMVMGEKELRNTAYHEAGHTLVGALMPNGDPVHKVTIIPRGRALGLTQQLPEHDRLSVSKDYALDQICMLFGGRVAEQLKFDVLTTGAGNDLERATDMARKMVCQWGMSEALGPVTFASPDSNSVFLGRDINRSQEYSEQTSQIIDTEVRKILDEQFERCETLIRENMETLESISVALLKYETLQHDDIKILVEGGSIEREPPKNRMRTREEIERARKDLEDDKPRVDPACWVG